MLMLVAAAAAAATADANDEHVSNVDSCANTHPLPHSPRRLPGIPRSSSASAAKVPIIVTTSGLNRVPLLKVSCGKNFTVVLDVKGLIWSWGSNKFGQLGLGHKQEGVIRLPDRVVNTEEPCQLEFSR